MRKNAFKVIFTINTTAITTTLHKKKTYQNISHSFNIRNYINVNLFVVTTKKQQGKQQQHKK